ncbi:ABC transporter ATP-binding protein [Flavobacteriaceae bacterium 3-367]
MIAINHLRFHYPKDKMVLNNISLELESGNIYGLFGKNGEGKSTLIKIMAGLLYPKTGSCLVMGERSERRTVKGLQEIFIVPEEFELPGIRIASYARINAPFYPNFSKDRFNALLEEFKLGPHERIGRLSFGQKKKVLIAFGIAANTKVLLMDEPTNGLDIPSKSQFRKIMASAVDQGKCIVISTHQVRDLHSLINHVVILDNAGLVFDRSLYEVSEGLWFGKAQADDTEHLIFSEASFGGKSVLPRAHRDETEVDLELLFNAVLTTPEQINQALNIATHGTTV